MENGKILKNIFSGKHKRAFCTGQFDVAMGPTHAQLDKTSSRVCPHAWPARQRLRRDGCRSCAGDRLRNTVRWRASIRGLRTWCSPWRAVPCVLQFFIYHVPQKCKIWQTVFVEIDWTDYGLRYIKMSAKLRPLFWYIEYHSRFSQSRENRLPTFSQRACTFGACDSCTWIKNCCLRLNADTG